MVSSRGNIAPVFACPRACPSQQPPVTNPCIPALTPGQPGRLSSAAPVPVLVPSAQPASLGTGSWEEAVRSAGSIGERWGLSQQQLLQVEARQGALLCKPTRDSSGSISTLTPGTRLSPAPAEMSNKPSNVRSRLEARRIRG
ncbi:hypothetical protein KIL84_005566 [Mauremys mutica]|uniref:Uncharacterized protein n=1 Tax=Mauremys mutica TaxID=74926 RepID=A0A9D3XGY3_9SAUR|nr:hypothetical protein KIL84_005566 [Mauremys mutica]